MYIYITQTYKIINKSKKYIFIIIILIRIIINVYKMTNIIYK